MRRTPLTAAAALLILAAPASAAQADWQVNSTTDDGAVTSIVAESADDTGVLLSCSGDKLTVGVSTIPGMITERLATTTKRIKSRKANTAIGDGDAKREAWFYLPSTQVALSKKGITGKRFYNAAVRGDSVTWQLDGKSSATIQMPAMNDAFKSFASSCAVTNG